MFSPMTVVAKADEIVQRLIAESLISLVMHLQAPRLTTLFAAILRPLQNVGPDDLPVHTGEVLKIGWVAHNGFSIFQSPEYANTDVYGKFRQISIFLFLAGKVRIYRIHPYSRTRRSCFFP
jgi:hypothetical protein